MSSWLPLFALSDDQFAELIASGQTLMLGNLNELLVDVRINAASLTAFGIDFRYDRRAVHIRKSDLVTVYAAIAAHGATLARDFLTRPAPPGALSSSPTPSPP